MRKFTSAVVGLGQIGMGYDYACKDSSMVLTHASAFSLHPAFELVAGVDSDPIKRQSFTNKFGRPAFATVDEMCSELRPEVIALATSTNAHFDAFMRILPIHPRAIICEKPISNSIDEAKQIAAIADESKIALLVNYIRRFDPGVHKLKELLNQGRLGSVYKGVAWYGKGLLHNGSHFINLLEFLFGAVSGMRILSKGRELDDGDVEPDVAISFGDVEIFFLSTKAEHYSIADIEIIGTSGKVLYSKGGELIEYWECEADATYPDYVSLGAISKEIESEMNRYQLNVADNLSNFLSGKGELISDAASALRTMEVVQKIKILVNT